VSDSKTAIDHIRYDILARDALRGVLRQVLSDVAVHGLPGDHHFYVTFATESEGVKISPRLQAQYPQEITIVLQHQFWDLRVTDELFEVGLSFNGIPERLVVPFSAIKSFFDPSVQFGLQFETVEAGEGEDEPAAVAEDQDREPDEIDMSPANTELPADDDTPPSEGAQVVRLDRFRKK